jgi:hypothetical protein
MALRIHPLEQMASHAPHLPAPISVKTSSTPSPTTTAASSTGQDTQAPSFTAVFAQIAAAAAAAGTTVASTLPAPGGTAQSPAATSTSAIPTATAAADDPAGPLFGPSPWLTDPTGQNPDGTVTHYNPVYFATQQTAQTVAQMLGGTVTQSVQITTAPGSPFQQNEPNYMVQLPNGGQVNPGFIADLYTHGWNQTFINQQIAAEVAGAQPAINS